MQRIKISQDLEFSRIVYGMWRLGDDTDTSPKHIQHKIHACLEQDITTIDQADIYGGYMAEELFGAALKGTDLRQKIEIVTKCGIIAPAGRHASASVKHYDTSPEHIRTSVDHSLRLMGIEQIDLLLIHRPDPFMDHHATGATLDDLIASGKIKAAGVSNFKPYDMDVLQSAMQAKLVVNQIELSLLEHQPFTNGDIAYLQQHDIGIMAWSPLGGGELFSSKNKELSDTLQSISQKNNCDIASVAVAWLLAHPSQILPVMGTNKLDRIQTLAQACTLQLERTDWFALYTAALGGEVA